MADDKGSPQYLNWAAFLPGVRQEFRPEIVPLRIPSGVRVGRGVNYISVNSRFERGGNGVTVEDGGRAIIIGANIKNNRHHGIQATGASDVTAIHTNVEGNGYEPLPEEK